MLKAQGNLLLDDNNKPFRLLGAQLESGFNYIKRFASGAASVTDVLNPNTFKAMASWNMNEVRIPISCWMYQLPNYLTMLDTVIQQANSAGLYVVLAMFDDGQSGSTLVGSDYPKLQNIQFWKDIATRYLSNPMVIFDLYNEPKINNWAQWLSGDAGANGVPCIGFKPLIDVVLAIDSKRLLILPPGGDWVGFDPTLVSGYPNLIFTRHIYESIIDPPDKQALAWGVLLDKYPLYYGEAAALTNAQPGNLSHCQNLPTDPVALTKVVNDFFAFCDARQIGLNIWQFGKGHLVQDMTTFAPTSLDVPWACDGTLRPTSGMGELVKAYFMTAAPVPLPPVPPIPVPLPPVPPVQPIPPTPTPTPTPAPLPQRTEQAIEAELVKDVGELEVREAAEGEAPV
jgi:hypothetical protein